MDQHPAEHDELVAQFCAMTGVSTTAAIQYLANNNGDIEAAIAEFFAEEDEALEDDNLAGGRRLGTDESPAGASGGRSLDSGTASSSSAGLQSSSAKRSAPKKKFATLGDFASTSGGDSSDDDGSEDQDFFAGGEKSGLAVQNPDDLKKKILDKARRVQQPTSEEPQSRPSHFTGAARTLGGDDAPSRVIEDTSEPAPQRPQRVQRTLHFWADGFSVDDGELYRSDDPRNAEILEGIRQGRAPLGIMNVQAGQEVDVELKQHEEKYIKPKPKYKPFSGAGQRLGSPTPGIQSQTPTPTATRKPAGSSDWPPKVEVDESQPAVTVQIRLGDGTRLNSRFNTDTTIGQIYGVVAGATPDGPNRAWVLMTTFPNVELEDMEATLADLPDFKRGGVLVQKWK
ncbi:UBX domain-containing protein 1 [Penicillium herquei]|nr:UBX domain-containing protein 1 [Penicillium herquei]